MAEAVVTLGDGTVLDITLDDTIAVHVQDYLSLLGAMREATAAYATAEAALFAARDNINTVRGHLETANATILGG